MTSFLIYGSGGHANVLSELGRVLGAQVVAMFTNEGNGQFVRDNIIIRSYDPLFFPELPLILGIGNNATRERLTAEVSHAFPVLLHPRAYVAADVQIGEGSAVLANATVQTTSIIGKHVIVNAGAVIEHDAVIGDFVHVAAGAYVGGGAVIEKGALIGQGAVIMRRTVIKQGTVVPPLTVVGV